MGIFLWLLSARGGSAFGGRKELLPVFLTGFLKKEILRPGSGGTQNNRMDVVSC